MIGEPVIDDMISKQDVDEWFNDFVVITGGDKKDAKFDEVAAFMWSALLCKMERKRSIGKLFFAGPVRRICTLEDLKEMMNEYEITTLKSENKPQLSKVRDFLFLQINGLLKHRGVKREQ